MTIKDYYAFLREVQQLYYPNSTLKDIKKMKNVKDAYECKKIEEECVKCHNTNYFQVPKPKIISESKLTKQIKYIPPTQQGTIKKLKSIPKLQTIPISPPPPPPPPPPPKSTPNKKKDEIETIIENLDDMYIGILISQSKDFKNIIHTIETAITKKKLIVIPQLFYDSETKKILNNAFNFWNTKVGALEALNMINNAMINLIEYISNDNYSKIAPLDDYTYQLYLKKIHNGKKYYSLLK